MKNNRRFLFYILVCLSFILSCAESKNNNSKSEESEEESTSRVKFTVIGDVPYTDEQREDLVSFIDAHNSKSKSEFLVHVGDIKAGKTPCDEDIYKDVSSILKEVSVPTFIILGDNEYNDCDDPDQGLAFWNTYFLHLNKNWDFKHEIAYQENRTENFSWSENGVLFIGINLVGSQVHDLEEWDTRLLDNAKWVEKLLKEHKASTKAAIVFAHANIVEGGPKKFEPFTRSFRAAAKTYGMPLLFVHGDGHSWIKDKPWGEKNILRVQVDNGAKHVQVTVNTTLDDPFVFDRNFLN